MNVCQQFSKEKQNIPLIAIFDRDVQNIIPKVHDDNRGFKDWGNGVYSFALPIPQHRKDNKEICIELYYNDEEIQTADENGRRIYLNCEFHPQSGRHKTLNLNTTDKSKLKNKQLKLLDNSVFDENNSNVALSKNNFADYIFQDKLGFNDFGFEAFEEVFIIIEKIVKHHVERIKNNL